MKPINIKKIGFAVCLMSILSFMGCVNDDLSVCGITIVFKYTNNMNRVDKFDSDVKNVNLYVFDSEGIFIDEFRVIGSTVKLNLMSGRYNLVAWGNLTNSYIVPELQSGVSKLDDFVLKINRLGNEVTEHPAPLYYGNIMEKEIKGDKMFSQVDTIDMIKDTKYIRVTSKGLPVSSNIESDFACEITSLSAELKYDNTVAGDMLDYKPKLSLDSLSQMVSTFALTREYGAGNETTGIVSITNSNFIVSYTPSNGGPKEILREFPLYKELLKMVGYSQDLWNRQDTFNLTLVFYDTFGNMNVSIEEWEDTNSNKPL